jgi:uncharacterized protein YbjQ (UPF0145 family)
MDIIITIIALIICCISGTCIERNHYKKIKKREIELYKKPYYSFSKKVNTTKQVKHVELVTGSVVLGCDNFKALFSSLISIFGGNISVFESVLDRGRREAILRMRENAKKHNADIILNVKIDTVMISCDNKLTPQVSVTAYGTAIKYERKQQ